MRLFKRALAYPCAVLLLGFPALALAQSGQTAGSSGRGGEQSLSAITDEVASDAVDLPDSPGAMQAQAESNGRTTSSSSTTSSANQQSGTSAQPADSSLLVEAASSSSQAPSGQSPQAADPQVQQPVGAAVAESPAVTGISAAQPAGVAIAPAKQRRVRTIVLKVGAIVGAGVAIGAVVALNAATPSKPPGAH